MGMCRIPNGSSSTEPVYFAEDEIINIPVHINDRHVEPERDIYISGEPQFIQKVEMGESRYAGTSDKYSGVIGLFEGGIIFDQPDVRITDEAAVQSKVDRFRDSTNPAFVFTPIGTAEIPNPYNAVQFEFFVDSGGGQVRITNNCTVRGCPPGEYDYRIIPGSGGDNYTKYDIYGYHYRPDSNAPVVYPIESTYVTQTFAGKESDPGGQIFVNGNVVLGSADFEQMVVQGKLTIVATGNIWIADSIVVDGADGIPDKDNPNILGLIAQGVIKVIDPGLANYGSPSMNVPGGTTTHTYVPVANGSSQTNRFLPDPTIIEAAVTVGGGGWGAENVNHSYTRKEYSPPQDYLILIGTISESVRGVVGVIGREGYIKRYTIDERLLEGVLPGNIWFGGKYIPAPAGWHDYRLKD